MESDAENCDFQDQWNIESDCDDDVNIELKLPYPCSNKTGIYAKENDAWVVESDNGDLALAALNLGSNFVPDTFQDSVGNVNSTIGKNPTIVESVSDIDENDDRLEHGDPQSSTIPIPCTQDTVRDLNSTIENRQGRPKRGRKRKFPEQSSADRKRLRNINKPFINSKGVRVEAKTFDENFICECKKKCTSVVSVALRKRLFNQYNTMGSFGGRCALLVSCIINIPKKQTPQSEKSRRVIKKYSISGQEVCKIALIRTLQINECRLVTAWNKYINDDSFTDGRGQSRRGFKALSLVKRVEVHRHIESFPKYVSHYTRSQTESKYLNSELNLSKMYRLYQSSHDFPVSKSSYKKIFYQDFNLRFKVPKKDTCVKCDLYITQIKNSCGAERLMVEDSHTAHLVQADSFREKMNADLALAKLDNEVETLTFDMQKILVLPRIPSSITYYKRQLNMYNLGIHVGSTGKSIFNVWLEYEASKGTQEVGSCLKKYIESIASPVKKLVLWSDSCGGQNRSIKFVLMMIYVLQKHLSLESISMRYLQSGHSFLPNDSDFGDVECSLKTKGRLYTDADYMAVMSDCRIENKFCIERLHCEDFFSVKLLEDATTNRKKDIDQFKVSWLNTHEIMIEKSDPFTLKMRNNFQGVFQSVNIKKRGPPIDLQTIELEHLWPLGKPLSNEKVKDLKELLNLIPNDKKEFYAFLDVIQTREFEDDVDGFGEFIDFELE